VGARSSLKNFESHVASAIEARGVRRNRKFPKRGNDPLLLIVAECAPIAARGHARQGNADPGDDGPTEDAGGVVVSR
jgi:hypothetical protein